MNPINIAVSILSILFWIVKPVAELVLRLFLRLLAGLWVLAAGRPELDNWRVVDGDTIRAGAERIRLAGIDAPEKSQGRIGDEATRHLENLLCGRKIEIQRHGQDHYGRTIATVFANGEDVNHRMVRHGYARSWKGKYKRDETKAFFGRAGLWAEGGIPCPSEHRARERADSKSNNKPASLFDWLFS